MTRETIIAVVAIVAIIIGNNVTDSYANQAMEGMSTQLDELRGMVVEQIEEENAENKAKDKVNQIYGNWEEKYNKLAYFIEHDELEKIESALTQVRTNIEMEEYQEAVVQLDETIFLMSHLESKLDFQLENIF